MLFLYINKDGMDGNKSKIEEKMRDKKDVFKIVEVLNKVENVERKFNKYNELNRVVEIEILRW